MDFSDFARYPTGNLCNAHGEVRALSSTIRPLIANRRIAGPARTARITPGQNAAIHRAIHKAAPGEILVVDGGASARFGPFGDLLAEFCKMRGLAGAVFDCTIRDSADIAAMGFQVFATGRHPQAAAKSAPGETDVILDLAGVRVAPGDILVGDDDGVVVIPRALAGEVLDRVAAVARREETIRSRILAGESTCEIFDISNI